MQPALKEFIDLTPTPQALIRVAIKDLERVEQNPIYTIDMQAWHMPFDVNNEQCGVCFAGACMTRFTPFDKSSIPADFPSAVTARLYALDFFRVGNVKAAFTHLNITGGYGLVAFDRPPAYEDDPDRFKKNLLALANGLDKFDFKILNFGKLE